MKVEEEQKSMIHEYNAGCWLQTEIDKFRLSIGFITGKSVDEWSNTEEAGAVYVQNEFDKEYAYVFKIVKRGNLVDFIVTKGLIDSPLCSEPIARMSPDHEYASQILSYLSQCGKAIDITGIHEHIRRPVHVQLSLF